LGRSDKATTPSIGTPPSDPFISSSRVLSPRTVRQGPVSKLVATPGNRIPAQAGIVVPVDRDSCPSAGKVICGRGCGGKSATTTTTASMPCLPNYNKSPANADKTTRNPPCRLGCPGGRRGTPDDTPGTRRDASTHQGAPSQGTFNRTAKNRSAAPFAIVENAALFFRLDIMDTDAVSDIKIVRQVQGDDGAACV
jgi:hypothetical protein